jgi:phenylacetate-CoA ligase
MLERFYKNVVIRGFESGFKRRNTFAYWNELERTQWLSPAELAERQLAALRRLVAHAAANCRYYSQTWRSLGLDPAAIKSLADFQQWPVIDRDTIRQNRIAMRAAVAGLQLMKKATGGSSGVPLEFDLDLESDSRRHAAWHRGYSWAGAGPGTRQWYLWGQLGTPPAAKRLKDALYYRIYRRTITNSFGMSEASLPWYLDQLNRCQPHAIVAYTNPLYDFARALEEHDLHPFAPRSIVVGAEKLHDFQRQTIERVFRAPVFETYGSREFMLIGSECERHSGLHLSHENLLVEILDDDGHPVPAGSEGNVAITDLTNYGMPFIRYLNGDRAIAGCEACPCGRGLPLLKQVVGRRLDMLETPDGRHIPGEFFPHVIKEFAAVRRFQVVQELDGSIQLRLVVGAGWNEAARQTLEQQVRNVVGQAASFEIAVVDEIPLTAAGKRRVVIRRQAPAEAVHPGSLVTAS